MADSNKLNDPSRSPLGGHPQPGPERLQTDLQADPELVEGPASVSRIVAFGAAIVVVLGVVFYGLNNTAQAPDATGSTASQSTPVATPPSSASTAQQTPAPGQNADSNTAASPAPNTASGTTTGSAPAKGNNAATAK